VYEIISDMKMCHFHCCDIFESKMSKQEGWLESVDGFGSQNHSVNNKTVKFPLLAVVSISCWPHFVLVTII